MSYITSAQVLVREKLLVGHDIDDLILDSDDAVESLCASKGVIDPDDIASPVPFELEEYAIYWVIERALERYAGLNDNDLQLGVDRYLAKLNSLYKGRSEDIGSKISYEIIIGDAVCPVDYATVNRKWRS